MRRDVLALFSLLCALLAGFGCDRKIAGGKADGPGIFASHCARCHGEGGIPDEALVARLGVKPLASERVQIELSDDDLRQRILKGSENKLMPGFRSSLNDAQVSALVRHLRSLSNK